MRRKIISFVVLILLLSVNAWATEEYEFTSDFITGLECRIIANEKFEQATSNLSEYENEMEETLAYMKNIRLASNKLELAKSYLEKHLDSTNSLIKETAEITVALYDKLISNNNDGIKFYEEMYSPQAINNPQNINVGKMMTRVSEYEAQSEEASNALMYSAIMVTYILTNATPDQEGKMSYLAVTSEERQELINKLDNTFGDSIKGGPKAGQSYLNASGAIIRKVLTDKYKSADER